MPEPSEGGRARRSVDRAPRTLHERLVDVLCDVRYPAERWEIIAGAAARGVDRVTAYRLARLPYRTYPDLDAVLAGVFAAQPSVPSVPSVPTVPTMPTMPTMPRPGRAGS